MNMAGKGKVILFTTLGLGVFAFALTMGGPQLIEPTKKKGRKVSAKNITPELRALVDKWCNVFGVPTSLMLAIMAVESGYNPRATNKSERAMKGGGAYGLTQLLLSTAQNLTSKNPTTAAKYWPGFKATNMTAETLYDPVIHVPMAAFAMAGNWKRYKDKPNGWLVAGTSWNQGVGNMDKRLAQYGANLTADLMPPNGKIYWGMLESQKAQNPAVIAAISQERGEGATYA